ncbi:MAG TPA: alpha/beta fold hydrolase [Steroidobacteraceae bacterium]|jgi:pimeloyl-ACP methyl ester carboxylesterase|nr:alpha/beta fold hydrolase [Steroidobacteraceae bacterium]
MTSGRFERPGGWLKYEAAGDGDPVVFLHGFGLDAAMWDPQWPVFAAAGHRAIRYDLRGYGASSTPEGHYSHVDDYLALAEFLRAHPAHIVALSMGGRVALRIAAQEPEAVRSLTLVDTALDGHAWSKEWLQRSQQMMQAARRQDIFGAKQLWLQHPLFDPARGQAAVAASLEAMISRYSGWHWWQKDPDVTPQPPSAEVLARIAVPTLMIVGELDLPDFQSIARRVAADMPRVTLRAIPKAGHMVNMEAPREFNELVLEHLRRS